jgi:hypothetical protein
VLVAKKRISAKTSARAATKSGWRKPAVVRERTRSGKKTRAIADAFRSHGGLTPAALGKRAFVHRFSLTDRAPRAAGVSQPWCANVLVPEKKPAPLQVAEGRSILTARRLFPVPRRADARRSWKRAFVHRECVIFQRPTPFPVVRDGAGVSTAG